MCGLKPYSDTMLRLNENLDFNPHLVPCKFQYPDRHVYRLLYKNDHLYLFFSDRPTGYKQPLLSSVYSPTSQRKEYRSSYQLSNQSSDDRPPSPSGRSDISESTTVLMAGFESYKPLNRSGESAIISFTH